MSPDPWALADFDYPLPPELVAQTPAPRRDASRLMVLDRTARTITLDTFTHLDRWLRAGDLLVANDTRVFPARLWGRKATGGRVEVLLLERLAASAENDHFQEDWACLASASKRPRAGVTVTFGEGGAPAMTGCFLAEEADRFTIRLTAADPIRAVLERIGQPPLPPYIHRRKGAPLLSEDRERYQTVYAREEGAIAAPTAGLHFTPDLLERLSAQGIAVVYLTLHVGHGTFKPIATPDVRRHTIPPERYSLSPAVATAVNQAREAGRRVVAVGTTSVRALESAADASGRVQAGAGSTDLFLRPGVAFRVINALITNFHLPKSSLLVLACAFAGRDFLLEAYARAVQARFRFYSYGDAMLIQ